MRLSHAEAQALVSARLDGPLDPVAERELNAHLATCESCRAFSASASRLASGLQNLPYLPASPAVTRAVLEHVSAPRTPWSWLTGAWSPRAMPTIAAVATAVMIVFIGTFTALRLLDADDDPSQIPASTQPSNLAVRPSEDDETEEPATDVPGGEQPGETEAPPTDVSGSSDQGIVTEDQAPPTESARGDQAETSVAPTDAPAEGLPADEATEAPAPTTEPDDATRAGETGLFSESATEQVGETTAPETESGEDLDTIGPPSATREPADTPTTEPDTPDDAESSAPATGADEGSGAGETSLFVIASPTESSDPTAEPTEVPTEEPTAEPTAIPTEVPTEAPTEEPTAEPTPTDVPTEAPTPTEIPTEEPTEIPTAVPTEVPTEEPSPTPTPTEEPSPTPTLEPTPTPTLEPTEEPTAVPTEEPTPTPTDVPTEAPTEAPTAIPTEEPTPEPTEEPTVVPIEPLDGEFADATEAPDESTEDEQTGIVPEDGETPEGTDAGDDGTDVIGPPDDSGVEEDTPETSGTDDAETPIDGDGTGEDQVIEPRDDEAPADDGEDDPGDADGDATDVVVESPEDEGDDEGAGQQAGQGGGLTLSDAAPYAGLGDLPGDGERLGLGVGGDLGFSANPGRGSLEFQGYVAGTTATDAGQVVEVCSPDGACVAASAGTAPGGQVDSPIGWLDGAVIYERQGGATHAIEYRALRLVPGTLEVADDTLLGGGGADLEFFLRPYPVGGGLLVPTASSWLFVTTGGVQPLDANPYGEGLTLPRVYPDRNLVAYVAGGSLIVARLDAPGSAIATLPFDGHDYDLAPTGDRVAVISGTGIAVLDLQGTVLETYPNDGGLSLGGIAWIGDGILFVDHSTGVIRILPS